MNRSLQIHFSTVLLNSKIEIPAFLKYFFISYSFVDKGIKGVYYSTSATNNEERFLSFCKVRDEFITYVKNFISSYDCKRDTPLLYEKSRNNNTKTLTDLNLFLDQLIKCVDELEFILLLFTQLTLLTPFFDRKAVHISLNDLYITLFGSNSDTRPYGHRSYTFLGLNVVSCNSTDFSLFYLLMNFMFTSSQLTIINGKKIIDSGTCSTNIFFNFDYTSTSAFQTIVNQLFGLSQFCNITDVSISNFNKKDRVYTPKVSQNRKETNFLGSSMSGGSLLKPNKNAENRKFGTLPYRDKNSIKILYNGKVIYLSEKFIPDFKIFLESALNDTENSTRVKKN